MGNLFALRTPSPTVLKRSRSPVGKSNDLWLGRLRNDASLTVAGWGNDGAYQRRGDVVRVLLFAPHALGLTKLGQPRHPLYVSAATRPMRWDLRERKA